MQCKFVRQRSLPGVVVARIATPGVSVRARTAGAREMWQALRPTPIASGTVEDVAVAARRYYTYGEHNATTAVCYNTADGTRGGKTNEMRDTNAVH